MASYDDLDFEWSLLCKENECAAWTENGMYLSHCETLSFVQFAYFFLFHSPFFSTAKINSNNNKNNKPKWLKRPWRDYVKQITYDYIENA